MKPSNFVKILKKCENKDDWRDVLYDIRYAGKRKSKLILELEEKGYIIKSEDHYGGEGQGDDYWDVFSVEHNAEITYFRLDGWYSSYDGDTYNDPYKFIKVKKVPKQIFEWVKDE